MNTSRWIAFELPPTTLGHPVTVRLGDFDERWVAAIRCGSTTTNGLGASPREALTAALAPLGSRATAALMAEPAMFAASADLLARAAM